MDLSRYADLFLTESREHLSAINHALLELERGVDGAGAVDAIFRAVHTVKGMSATMGYAPVAELSHEMETLLDRVRRGEGTVTRTVMDALFQAADALEAAIELSVTGGEVDLQVAAPLEQLRRLAAEAPVNGSSPEPAAAAANDTGGGRLVRIWLSPDAPLRGVRALLALRQARALGAVHDVRPPESALESGSVDGELSFRLDSPLPQEEIERSLRGVGDVERVEVSMAPQPASPAVAADSRAPEGAGSSWRSGVRPQRHVRIDLRRLDNLMNLIGELVITRGRLVQLAGGLGDAALDETVGHASRLISDLQDEIMTTRMVPVGQVFDRFPRLVRDAAHVLGKQVEFTVEGTSIELDRSMLDEIGEPIVHLLRNAVDHGFEAPEDRVRAGKPRAGRLHLSAARDRSAVMIRVTDDGRGIDRSRVLARAQELGLVERGKAELSDEELFRVISLPGFSTATKVTDISGRGVGVDAVVSRVRSLGGSMEIRSQPGVGTTVTVRLPITLAILRALLTRVGDEVYAVPMTHVSETVEIAPGALATVRGRDVLMLRDDILPVLHLSDLVRVTRSGRGTHQQIVVLEIGERRAGLMVDELAGQQEIVVKQFEGIRDGLPLFSGATILGDGAPALILDVSTLL